MLLFHCSRIIVSCWQKDLARTNEILSSVQEKRIDCNIYHRHAITTPIFPTSSVVLYINSWVAKKGSFGTASIKEMPSLSSDIQKCSVLKSRLYTGALMATQGILCCFIVQRNTEGGYLNLADSCRGPMWSEEVEAVKVAYNFKKSDLWTASAGLIR